jgi:hypothetical protein
MQPLTIALGNYGITKPIKQADADLGRLNLDFVPVEQIVPMMRRMCRGLEFDICEMAFTTYVCARAVGLPFIAIPVFVTRNFHHWAVFVNTRSGVKKPTRVGQERLDFRRVHRAKPEGARGHDAVRGGPEDGAAEIFGRRAVHAVELAATSIRGSPNGRARNPSRKQASGFRVRAHSASKTRASALAARRRHAETRWWRVEDTRKRAGGLAPE